MNCRWRSSAGVAWPGGLATAGIGGTRPEHPRGRPRTGVAHAASACPALFGFFLGHIRVGAGDVCLGIVRLGIVHLGFFHLGFFHP